MIFDKGRVAQAFTVWRPNGWKTPTPLPRRCLRRRAHLRLLDKRECVATRRCFSLAKVTSVFYVFQDKVWGFGLMKPGDSPCL